MKKKHKYLLLLSLILFIFALIKYSTSSNPITRLEFGLLMILLPVLLLAFAALSKPLTKYHKLTGHSYLADRMTSQAPAGLISAIKQAEKEQTEIKKSYRNRANIKGASIPSGILFGRTETGRYVCDPAVHGVTPHVFVYGPSGSGKTQCVLLPTIASWPDGNQILALDISGDITETLKQNPWMQKEKPIILDLDDWRTPVHFDPFGSIREIEKNQQAGIPREKIMEQQFRELEEIAFCLVPPLSAGSKENSYFLDGGRDLLTAGLSLGFFQGKTFAQSLDWIMNSKLERICKDVEHSDYHFLKPLVRQFSGQNERNLSGIRGEASKACQRICKNSTLETIFTPPESNDNAILLTPDMIETKSIYVRIRMEELEVYSAVIGLIFHQFITYFYSRPLGICEQHPILFLCDELASYAKYIPNLENHFRNLRKFGVRFLCCVQDFSSLKSAIGEDKEKTIWANCGWKVILSTCDESDQRTIANIIGKEKTLQRSASFGRIDSTTYTNRIEYDFVVRPEDLATLGLSETMNPSDHGRLVLIGPSGFQILWRIPFWANISKLKDAKNRNKFYKLT